MSDRITLRFSKEMPPNNPLSYPAVIICMVLLAGLVATHVRVFRAVSVGFRCRYLLVFSLMFIGTLFIPVFDGGAKFGWIPLWTAYRILCIPEFYLVGNRDLLIDFLVFEIPVAQHLLCFTLALIYVKRKKILEMASPWTSSD